MLMVLTENMKLSPHPSLPPKGEGTVLPPRGEMSVGQRGAQENKHETKNYHRSHHPSGRTRQD